MQLIHIWTTLYWKYQIAKHLKQWKCLFQIPNSFTIGLNKKERKIWIWSLLAYFRLYSMSKVTVEGFICKSERDHYFFPKCSVTVESFCVWALYLQYFFLEWIRFLSKHQHSCCLSSGVTLVLNWNMWTMMFVERLLHRWFVMMFLRNSLRQKHHWDTLLCLRSQRCVMFNVTTKTSEMGE